jgi:serine/threonine-protein kinase
MGGVLGSLSWNEHGLLVTLGANGVFLFPPDSTDGRRIVETLAGEAVSSAQMLPGGQHVLMTLLSLSPQRPGSATGQVVVHALQSGTRTQVIDSGSDARYVRSGHIVYAANGALYAMEFDVKTLRARGEPWAVVEGVRATNIINATTHYTVSDTGTLAYVPGQPVPPALALDLVQTDRKGGVRHLHLPAAPYEWPRVSPDGRQVATSTDDGNEASIWIHDLAQPSSLRKLTVMGRNRFPVWSPDGRRIAFQSTREGDIAIFAQAADGSDVPVRLTTAEKDVTHTPESWSPNGDDLLFAVAKEGTTSLWRLSLPTRRVEPFAKVSSSGPLSPAFSPNGKWVAYNTRVDNVTFGAGHATFVQPFPPTGAVYQISSNDDGHHPVWSRDGRELFYIPGPGRLSVVTVAGGSSFTFSSATSLPPAGLMGPGTLGRHYDVLPDGSGFVGRQVAEDEESRRGAPPRIHVVTNWFEDLNRRRPR